VYYKRSTDTWTMGNSAGGRAREFNFARGFSRGAEFKINYTAAGCVRTRTCRGDQQGEECHLASVLIGDPVEFAYLPAITRTPRRSDDNRLCRRLLPLAQPARESRRIYGSGLRAGFATSSTLRLLAIERAIARISTRARSA